MSETNEIIKRILSEIQAEDVEFVDGKISEFEEETMDSYHDKLAEAVSANYGIDYDFHLQELKAHRDTSNRIHRVEFYPSVESGNRVKRFVKAVIRRLIAPVMETIILEQNRFNASVASSINMICDNHELVEALVKEQEKQNHLLQRDIKILEREVERLRKKNLEAQMEVISARKKLHRDIVLLREVLTENQEKEIERR